MPIRMLLIAIAIPLIAAASESPHWDRLRERMVTDQIQARGIEESRLLEAMRSVPRHVFVPEAVRSRAYGDSPVPIGYEQTISQPFIVAYMTHLLELEPHHRVFELGTGSGYQAAVASRLAAEVYTVEIVPELAQRALATLADLGYDNVHVRAGDGWVGWPEAAPFDRILVTAAAPELPGPLIEQLRPGGRMILPLGPAGGVQELVFVRKDESGAITTEDVLPVRFVPVTGRED